MKIELKPTPNKGDVRLTKSYDGEVQLVFTDVDDEQWVIATIDEDGLDLWEGIPREAGMAVDRNGRVRVYRRR